jgi:hypothetical protein
VVEDSALVAGPADDAHEAAIAAVISSDADARWTAPDGALEFDGTRWSPDLVGADGRVLHLSLGGELPHAYERRMRAAAQAGARVSFATAATTLELSTLLALQEMDARMVFVEERSSGWNAKNYRSVADWVALQRIALSPDDMAVLARQRLEACASSEPNAARGRWFEEALCLVFSQVSWLRVDEHAYRNETEEIDLVMSAHAAGYLAQLAGGPIVLATGKNEKSALGSSVVKYLKEQMANRKGRCKLGFLCSSSTVSADAKREILRGSQSSEAVLVPVDATTIMDLIDNADEIDEKVEALITKAIAD